MVWLRETACPIKRRSYDIRLLPAIGSRRRREADFGRAIALAVARRRVVFRIRPGGQGQFSPELAAQGIRHHRLSKLAEKIAEEPQEDWCTDTLAAEPGVSLRSLSRLFRKELNASPSQFVERVRIDQARRALLETEAQVEKVAIRCGPGTGLPTDWSDLGSWGAPRAFACAGNEGGLRGGNMVARKAAALSGSITRFLPAFDDEPFTASRFWRQSDADYGFHARRHGSGAGVP
jgi:AraC-like DNA-binding protein